MKRGESLTALGFKWSLVFGFLLLLTAVLVTLRFTDFEPNTDARLDSVPGYSFALEPKLVNFADERLNKKESESDLAYATRINKQIFNAYYHCNYKEVTNFSEWIASKIYNDSLNIGFLSPNRPCGWCHQTSFILSRTLVENGINAIPLGLNGHVVTLVNFQSSDEFEIGKLGGGSRWYIFDSDFGVGPFAYSDNMWSTISSFYPEYLRNDSQLSSAFQTISDDSAYYTLQALNQELVKQEDLLAMINRLHNLIVTMLFFMILVPIVIKIRSNKSKTKKPYQTVNNT